MDVCYTVFDCERIGEATPLYKYPFYPVYPGEQDLGLVEGRDELSFVVRKRTNAFVSGDGGLPILWIILAEAASETSHVGGDSLDSHCAEIDDPGDLVTLEENVVMPDIAEAGLQDNRDGGCRFENSLKSHQSGANEIQNFERSGSQRGIGA